MSEGRHPYQYFINNQWKWNWFDFVIVLISLPIFPFAGRQVKMLRLFRLARLARIFQNLPQLYMILMGLYGGIKSIVYIVALMGLTFYMYAVAGVIFFSQNDPWHFSSLDLSILSLLQLSTMDVSFYCLFICNCHRC